MPLLTATTMKYGILAAVTMGVADSALGDEKLTENDIDHVSHREFLRHAL